MIVAVTGGTGYIGAGVVQAHLSRGDEVRLLTRRASFPMLPQARLVRGDLARGEVPRQLVDGVDVLYHCAGEIRDQSRMHGVHVEGTRTLLSVASGSVGRLVHLSSVGVYGPAVKGEVSEETVEKPVGTYEVTKAASDRLVRDAHRDGRIEAVILRPSIVFGPTMPNRSLFALISAVDRGLFFFVGRPGASANYVPLENVVDALLLCGSSAVAPGQTFNLSAWRTMEELVGTIASALGKPSPRRRLPLIPLRAAAAVLGRIPRFPLSVSRVDALSSRAVYPTKSIESALGFRALVSVEDALRRTVAQWQKESRR